MLSLLARETGFSFFYIEPLDPNIANQTLTSMAGEYARIKQFDQALQVVELIKDNDLANWARVAIKLLLSEIKPICCHWSL